MSRESVVWDPGQYLRYADQRARPFHDLVARIGAEAPSYVVDLGCGPGNQTETLLARWPEAYVEGVDSSAEMIEAAGPLAQDGRLEFRLGDVRTWTPERPVDVLVSNATLQWVPGHLELLPDLVRAVAPGGWLAFQVPGNFDEPSHRLLSDLAASSPWAERFAGRTLELPGSHRAAVYLEVLADLGCVVEAWETTYLYVLQGADPVLDWIKGTGARPYLQALSDADRAEFEAEYRDLLRTAYPPKPYGTVLPFRRIFAVARRAS